jgi:hypothetical protein
MPYIVCRVATIGYVFEVSDRVVEPRMVDTYARPHDPNDSHSSILDDNGKEKRCQRTKQSNCTQPQLGSTSPLDVFLRVWTHGSPC